MTNYEYVKVLLSLNLEHFDNKRNLINFVYSRVIPCVFICGKCFSGFLKPEIINPKLFRECSDVWLNSEVK